MGETSIMDIIRALEGMKQELLDCCRTMSELMGSMRNDIAHLRANGFPIEKEEDYVKGYYQNAKETVDGVIEHISVCQINELERVIEIYRSIINC